MLCPTCGAALPKMPTRKTTCKSCRAPIYLKATPGNRTKRLMNETAALAAQAEWSAYEEHNKVLENLRTLQRTLSELRSIQEALSLTESAAVEVLAAAIAEDEGVSLHVRRMAHYLLAQACEDRGEPFQDHLWHANFFQLQELSRYAATKVEIMAAADACPSCRRLAGRVYTVRAALEAMPLPCVACTAPTTQRGIGYCRCMWVIGPD